MNFITGLKERASLTIKRASSAKAITTDSTLSGEMVDEAPTLRPVAKNHFHIIVGMPGNK